MKKLAFLVSGGGTNMQAILDAIRDGRIEAKACCVIASKDGVYALERAKQAGVDTYVVPSRTLSQADRDAELIRILDGYGVDYVVLAGYLSILSPTFVARYPRRILNIHPALLPKFGGAGMYGIHVHEAVLDAHETESGATVHYVDDGTDTGEIILQGSVPVFADDTPETLQKRVLDNVEHRIYPEALARLCNGRA